MRFRSRSRLLCSLLTFAFACTHAPAARASNDGKLCDGFNIVLCVPLFLVLGVAQALEPKSPYTRLQDAIASRDLEGARRVVLGAAGDERAGLLKAVVSSYLSTRDGADDVRLALINGVLDERRVDLAGAAGSDILQAVVRSGPIVASAEAPRDRQLAMARLFIAHGARAGQVALGDCSECNTNDEFLGLLMQAGADINRAGAGVSLYNQMVEGGKLADAEHLLALGADANGRPAGGFGLLQRIAMRCDMRPASCGCASPAPQTCAEQAVARARFVVGHGADPDGRTTWELGKCVTPYQQALKLENTALADALRELGADPEFSARCLAAAPRQP